jgi:hypothetical protein
MINAPLAALPPFQDPIENEPTASAQAAADKTVIRDRRLTLALDEKTCRVLFVDGPILKGKSFELFARLAIQFRSDHAAGKRPEEFSFVRTGELLGDLNIAEHTLGQRVFRIRKDLEQQFLDATDFMLDQQDVIQSDRWKGYRLNPYLLLVDASQLHESPKCHDS